MDESGEEEEKDEKDRGTRALYREKNKRTKEQKKKRKERKPEIAIKLPEIGMSHRLALIGLCIFTFLFHLVLPLSPCNDEPLVADNHGWQIPVEAGVD